MHSPWTWNSGSIDAQRSVGPRPHAAPSAVMFATTAREGRATPLLRPVVPEV